MMSSHPTKLQKGVVAAAATLISPVCLATPSASDGPTNLQPSARAELIADGQVVEIAEKSLHDGALERSFRSAAGQTLYRSVVKTSPDAFDVRVVEGHPSQLGRLQVRAGRLDVWDATGKPQWSERLISPLCLPELSAQFIRAHWSSLQIDAKQLRCVTSIIKDDKVAPLEWLRLPDRPGGTSVVELGPGSFGIGFFVVATRLTFTADGAQLLSQQGQVEASPRVDGRATYLRGTACYAQARNVALLAPDGFGPASANK